MPSGGWRPGAGRPRKIITEVKVKRPVGRPKKVGTDEQPVKVQPPKPPPTIESIIIEATRENLTAVEFMSREMNDRMNPPTYRLQCAQLLAPYETPKLAPIAKGKKEEKATKAGEVIKSNRFGQSQPPRLVKQ